MTKDGLQGEEVRIEAEVQIEVEARTVNEIDPRVMKAEIEMVGDGVTMTTAIQKGEIHEDTIEKTIEITVDVEMIDDTMTTEKESQAISTSSLTFLNPLIVTQIMVGREETEASKNVLNLVLKADQGLLKETHRFRIKT